MTQPTDPRFNSTQNSMDNLNSPSLQTKPDSSQGFANILFSIIIPVLILNKGSKYFGVNPTQALIIALAFPLLFGAYSFFKEKKMNYIALLGLINVLLSGVLTILALGGIWFAIKEAVFPLLIGIFVFFSSFSKSPFFQTMFLNPNTFNIAKLNESLNTDEKKNSFLFLMKSATKNLSWSFLLSAVLNFVLAINIFKPLAESLTETEKQELLNAQLGQMTAYSFVVIMVPVLVVVGVILFSTFKKTTAITGLKLEDLMIK